MGCMADGLIRPPSWLIGSPVYWVGPDRRGGNRRLRNDSCRLVDSRSFQLARASFGSGRSSRPSIASMADFRNFCGSKSVVVNSTGRAGAIATSRDFGRACQPSLAAQHERALSSRRGTELRMIRHFICPLIVQKQSRARRRRVPTPKY
jgi:hypothetical protein